MTDVERRSRRRVALIDRSIRSKALVVGLLPLSILVVALALSASWADRAWLEALDITVLVVAVVGGIALWHLATRGMVRRLQRLEHDTGHIEGGAEVPEPVGRDEIGRLAGRLEEAAQRARRHAEERDRARQELTDILTASPVVSLRYDYAEHRFSYASPNVGQVLGLSAEEAMADADAVIARFHPDDERRVRKAVVAGRGRGEDRLALVLRCRYDAESDEWHEVDALYSVEPDESGEARMVSAYLVDVSARHAAQRAAEERRHLLESIFHASPDTIVVRDDAGRVVLASSSLAETIGAEADEPMAADRLIDEAYRVGRLRRQDMAAIEDLIARCQAGEHPLDPVVTTGRGPGHGAYRTFETRARPVLDESGRVTGTVTVSRDITDRIRLEQSLRRATVAAERSSEAKSVFLSRMSHELRTPLNAILGFAQLLEMEPLPEDQASSVDQIRRAGHHLLALINEVLDIARIEAGQLTVSSEAVNVGEVLDEVRALLSPMAESAAVHMMVEQGGEEHRFVRADRQRLRQVLLNLGSNAVKYNEKGGTVAFRTSTGRGNSVRFSVHDTGPGIPEVQQDLLFQPFSRLGAERSGVEGTGVGLALSKQLVEVMGGTIGVQSAPGRGSTFWVELAPATPEAIERARAAGEAAGAAPPAVTDEEIGVTTTPVATADAPVGTTEARFVVLHVEDDPSNASFVSLVLSRRPEVRLISAADGRHGLELARRHRPHLVLLDLHLPDLSGDEVLAEVKATPELAQTKVVVVSADATPDRIRRLVDQGVEGYLTKPVDVGALLRVVDQQLAKDHAPPTERTERQQCR